MRTVFRVLPFESGWAVERGGQQVLTTRWKVRAVWHGRALAKAVQGRGNLAQLVVHGRSGRINFEWTYGSDPKRSEG